MAEHKHKTNNEQFSGSENRQNASREQVLTFIGQHPEKTISEIAKIFNISEKTIRAWKAHQTRGTYSGEKPTRQSQRQIVPFAEDEEGKTEKKPEAKSALMIWMANPG